MHLGGRCPELSHFDRVGLPYLCRRQFSLFLAQISILGSRTVNKHIPYWQPSGSRLFQAPSDGITPSTGGTFLSGSKGMTQDTDQPLSLTPFSQAKVVHFIRHGEGFHNIGFEFNLDPHLTEFGWQQAAALKQHLKTLEQPLNVQVVIVSPLVRTLETAAGVFGAEDLSGQNLLMLPTKAARHECTAHDAIAAPPTPPFVASGMCRERMGANPCDRRRPLKETKAAFPGADFGEISDEDDPLWEKLHVQPLSDGEYPSGESAEQVTSRGIDFLHWLMKRPENCIAVVSHADFLRHTLSAFAGAEIQDNDSLRVFNNCEMRSFVLSGGSLSSQGRADPTAFPGGREWLPDAASGLGG